MNWGVLFQVIREVAPIVLRRTKLAPIADQVAAGMEEAQGMVGATGEQKLAHVQNIARQAAVAANAQAGRQVIDPVAIDEASAGAISETKKVVNIIHAAHVDPVIGNSPEPAVGEPVADPAVG